MLRFITSNKQKFKEAQELLKPIEIRQLKINLEEIQEIDPHKIIKHKLNEAFKHHKGPFIIEDNSVTFKCLGGKLPGPFIKWFNDYLGNRGMAKLGKKMGDGAVASALIAFAESKNETAFFEGKVRGRIVNPRGDYLFGYDPIFLPTGSKQTLSEMKAKRDFSKSPRAIAIKKLKTYLSRYETR